MNLWFDISEKTNKFMKRAPDRGEKRHLSNKFCENGSDVSIRHGPAKNASRVPAPYSSTRSEFRKTPLMYCVYREVINLSEGN
jgi:hypothetical protein